MLLPVGRVAKPGEDPLPTTGPHLDVRVMRDGQYINPKTIRSLLTRLQVGGQPLYSQKGEEWATPFQVTSGFGARSAPTAGASTFHKGVDYGVGAGTELMWKGPGKFTPGKGYGVIETTDDKGTPYTVKLLHTASGKAGELGAEQQPAQVQPTQPTAQPSQPFNIVIHTGQSQKQETPEEQLNRFKKGLIESALTGSTQRQRMFDPISLLTQAASNQNYFT